MSGKIFEAKILKNLKNVECKKWSKLRKKMQKNRNTSKFSHMDQNLEVDNLRKNLREPAVCFLEWAHMPILKQRVLLWSS